MTILKSPTKQTIEASLWGLKEEMDMKALCKVLYKWKLFLLLLSQFSVQREKSLSHMYAFISQDPKQDESLL